MDAAEKWHLQDAMHMFDETHKDYPQTDSDTKAILDFRMTLGATAKALAKVFIVKDGPPRFLQACSTITPCLQTVKAFCWPREMALANDVHSLIPRLLF
jgi:hypothetical protein